FLAILNGGKLVIPKKSDILDNESFLELLSSQRVTHLHGVPSFLRAVDLRSFHSLRRIVSAGEPFDIDIFQAWLGDVEIYNKYGPTEATISATEYKVSDQSYHPLSIGKPIGRTQCYILGEGNTLQPEGVIGEICISGMG
ncbi:AMP-binding protein, partial [Aquimarina algiphila]|uniref:AMP-binding protein n=1 Tax=Aquimarina algiphila TaxID=2047982 RepID=UPI002490564B